MVTYRREASWVRLVNRRVVQKTVKVRVPALKAERLLPAAVLTP
jgi:hypothetical protein